MFLYTCMYIYIHIHVHMYILYRYIHIYIYTHIVTDRGKKECVDPEGNWVTMSEGAEGGPGPPGGEQDKQSVCSNGSGKMSMGEPEGQPDGLEATSRLHHTEYVTLCITVHR
jgi:hypothetical protein